MKPHQQRVVDEKAELDEKLKNLTVFYNTTVFDALDPAEKDRLLLQGRLISEYSDVLGQRIAAFV